jgi:hypothetical protein
MTFTKLFSSITESTIWSESSDVRLVWITMLAMADRRGRVWASVPGLANRARVPLADCREALAKFLGPDPDSRTQAFEGRRIEVIDGGWRLLNYEKYRQIRDDESVLEAKRRYINNRRAVERVDRGRANAEADSEAEAKGESPALSATDKISLERERKELKASLAASAGVSFRSPDEVAKRKAMRERIGKIEKALHIPL